MNVKRLFPALTLVTILSLVLVGCGPTPTPEAPTPTPEAPTPTPEAPTAAPTATEAPAEVVKINWLEWWDPEYGEELMDELIARFEAQHPNIKVKRTVVAHDPIYDTLVTQAQAGTAEYDVFGMEAYGWLASIDKLGGIEPLGPWLEEAGPEFTDGLTELTIVKWLGRPLMLNWYTMPYAYTYNMDVLEEAGLEPPTNWDELVEVTKALTEGDVVEYGFGASFQNIIVVPYYLFGPRLAQLGGRWYDDDGRAVFNSPEGVQALKDWRDLYQSGTMAPNPMGTSYNDVRDFMVAGSIAATFDGPWAGRLARQVDPDIRIAYSPAWIDPETGFSGYQWGGSGIAMSAHSEHKEEAWEFIKFLLSDETTVWMTEQTSVSFATKAAIASMSESDDPILRQIPAMMIQDPEHNLFLEPMGDWNMMCEEFTNAFQEVMEGERDPQEALDDVADIWNENIDSYR